MLFRVICVLLDSLLFLFYSLLRIALRLAPASVAPAYFITCLCVTSLLFASRFEAVCFFVSCFFIIVWSGVVDPSRSSLVLFPARS